MDKKILILVLILAAFLRFYHLDSLMGFIGEQGRDYLISSEIITKHKFPVLTEIYSVPHTAIGPFFYYLQAAALWIGNFNPLAPAVMTSMFGVFSVAIIYCLGKKLFDKTIAFYSAVFFAFSPLMVIISRISTHVAIYPFFILIYMLFLIDFLKGKSNNLIIIGLFLLIIIQVHLSSFVLIPITIILCYLNRKKIHVNKKNFAIIFVLFLPSFFIAKETVFTLGRLGVKKITSLITLKDLYITPASYFLEIFQKLFSMESLILGILFLPFFFFGLRKIFKKRDFSSQILITWFFVALAGLLVKNSPSEQYFFLITPAFFLITANGIKTYKRIGAILLLIFSLTNLYFLPKRDFYMNTANNPTKFNYGVPLSQRLVIAKYIVNTSQNKPFNIQVIGDFDIYPSTGKNYEYLAFWLKGKPSEKQENLKYVIYEPKEFAKIYKSEGLRKEFENAIVEYRSN